MRESRQPTQLRFRFPLSRHANCILALSLANTQARIRDGWCEAGISLDTLPQIQAAGAIAEALAPLSLQGAEAYGNDQRISLRRVAGILACYAKSFGVSDYRAHCWTPIARLLHDQTPIVLLPQDSSAPAVASVTARTWFFPCQYASPGAATITSAHPAPLHAQAEQVLTHYECRWCPRLRDLDQWELMQWGRDCDE